MPPENSELANLRRQVDELAKDRGRRAALYEVLRAAPDNVELRLDLVDLLTEERVWPEVIAQLEIALSAEPGNEAIRAKLDAAREQHRLASEHYTKAVELEELGGKHRDEALEHFRRAYEIEPRFQDVVSRISNILSQERQEAKAAQLRELRARVEAEPNNAQHHGNLGRFLLDHDRFVEAEAAFQRAKDLDPNNPLWYKGLAQANYSEMNWDGAIVCLKRLLDLQPTNSNAKRLLKKARARSPSRVFALRYWLSR